MVSRLSRTKLCEDEYKMNMHVQHPRHKAVVFEGKKQEANAPKTQKQDQSFMSKLSSYKAPIAAATLASMFAPGLAQAAITPESARLVKAAAADNDSLLEASLVQLGLVNETDALPTVKKVLAESKASEDTLNAAAKAAGLLGAKASDTDKAELSKLLLPYLQKVVFQDKDKNSRIISIREAVKLLKEDPKNTKIKDPGLAAAKALGQINHPATLSRLAKAAQDPMVGMDVRMLSLEAIKSAPSEPGIDGQLVEFMDRLDQKQDAQLLNKVAEIVIKHNAKSGWDKLEKLIAPPSSSSGSASSMGSSGPTEEVVHNDFTLRANNKAATPRPGIKMDDEEEGGMMFFFARRTPSLKDTVVSEVLKTKKTEHADFILKELKKDPMQFSRRMFDMFQFFRTTGPDTQKKFVEWVDVSKAEAAVKSENNDYVPESEKAAATKKIAAKAEVLREMSIIFSALLHQKDAYPEFQKLFTNNLENEGLRHLGIAAAAYVKDPTAAQGLLALTTDDTEDVDMRYDALMAVMDITTPPLSKELQSNTKRAKFFEKYVNTFKNSEKFTHSFYKAELFSEIRDARKLLIQAKAPLQEVDNITKKILDKKLADLHAVSEQRAELMKTPAFKEYASKMAAYVGSNKNADGFLRVLMIEALGEAKNTEVKDALKELINDPLARTNIPDVQSSNDMMMFPGYTKMEVANMTRLAAVRALGSSGSLADSELLEKALRSDEKRLQMYALEGLADLGKNVMDPRADITPKAAEQVNGLVDRLVTRMQKVQLHASPRMNNYWQKLYAEAIGQLGGQEKLLKLMETSKDGVLNRAIANGLIKNGQALDNPKVAQFLLVNSLGLSELHAKGIDGKGTEVAIIDGDYINDDIEGLQGKVVYPEWGNTKDAALRESFHGESVASVMVGRKANTTYGIAPGVDKIYSYAAWDDNQSADRDTPIEEADGMLRSIDDIVSKKIAGRTKVSVVNMSLGGTAGLLYADEEGAKQYLDKLAARFEAGSKAGITFIISAGNEGGDTMRHHLVGTLNLLGFNKQNGKLLQSNGVILVGATDTQGTQDRTKHTPSWFTSVGDVFNASQPDVMAPGTNIPLVNREANGVVNMDEMDGTSFSAPIVTGIALLMNQAAGKPLETEKLKEILKNNTYKLEDTPQFQQGAGGVDPTKAVEAAKKERVSASFGEFLNSVGSLFGPDVKKDPVAAPPKK
jgi:hypothetical protein